MLGMKVRTLISKHIEDHDLCPGATSLDQWLHKKWVQMRVGSRLVPVFPAGPIRDALNKHDVHHVLTGYPTTPEGEFELAAWELASGGCHTNLLFWADRFQFLLLGSIMCPSATLRALRRGWGSRNLYRMDISELLELDVLELTQLLHLPPLRDATGDA